MREVVCYCMNVTEDEILLAIKKGARTLKGVQDKTSACTGNECSTMNPSGKCCSGSIKILLNNSKEPQSSSCCNCS